MRLKEKKPKGNGELAKAETSLKPEAIGKLKKLCHSSGGNPNSMTNILANALSSKPLETALQDQCNVPLSDPQTRAVEQTATANPIDSSTSASDEFVSSDKESNKRNLRSSTVVEQGERSVHGEDYTGHEVQQSNELSKSPSKAGGGHGVCAQPTVSDPEVHGARQTLNENLRSREQFNNLEGSKASVKVPSHEDGPFSGGLRPTTESNAELGARGKVTLGADLVALPNLATRSKRPKASASQLQSAENFDKSSHGLSELDASEIGDDDLHTLNESDPASASSKRLHTQRNNASVEELGLEDAWIDSSVSSVEGSSDATASPVAASSKRKRSDSCNSMAEEPKTTPHFSAKPSMGNVVVGNGEPATLLTKVYSVESILPVLEDECRTKLTRRRMIGALSAVTDDSWIRTFAFNKLAMQIMRKWLKTYLNEWSQNSEKIGQIDFVALGYYMAFLDRMPTEAFGEYDDMGPASLIRDDLRSVKSIRSGKPSLQKKIAEFYTAKLKWLAKFRVRRASSESGGSPTTLEVSASTQSAHKPAYPVTDTGTSAKPISQNLPSNAPRILRNRTFLSTTPRALGTDAALSSGKRNTRSFSETVSGGIAKAPGDDQQASNLTRSVSLEEMPSFARKPDVSSSALDKLVDSEPQTGVTIANNDSRNDDVAPTTLSKFVAEVEAKRKPPQSEEREPLRLNKEIESSASLVTGITRAESLSPIPVASPMKVDPMVNIYAMDSGSDVSAEMERDSRMRADYMEWQSHFAADLKSGKRRVRFLPHDDPLALQRRDLYVNSKHQQIYVDYKYTGVRAEEFDEYCASLPAEDAENEDSASQSISLFAEPSEDLLTIVVPRAYHQLGMAPVAAWSLSNSKNASPIPIKTPESRRLLFLKPELLSENSELINHADNPKFRDMSKPLSEGEIVPLARAKGKSAPKPAASDKATKSVAIRSG